MLRWLSRKTCMTRDSCGIYVRLCFRPQQDHHLHEENQSLVEMPEVKPLVCRCQSFFCNQYASSTSAMADILRFHKLTARG
uniref:Uncharacterized protein n=1 Tax=Rhizophora mucronata TaxID=61149 RepID=A0A2P2K9W2_RHIMU